MVGQSVTREWGYYASISLEALRKTTRNLSQNNKATCQNSNQALPEYNSKVLPCYQLAVYTSSIAF
jgi:hypothetical protein